MKRANIWSISFCVMGAILILSAPLSSQYILNAFFEHSSNFINERFLMFTNGFHLSGILLYVTGLVVYAVSKMKSGGKE